MQKDGENEQRQIQAGFTILALLAIESVLGGEGGVNSVSGKMMNVERDVTVLF